MAAVSVRGELVDGATTWWETNIPVANFAKIAQDPLIGAAQTLPSANAHAEYLKQSAVELAYLRDTGRVDESTNYEEDYSTLLYDALLSGKDISAMLEKMRSQLRSDLDFTWPDPASSQSGQVEESATQATDEDTEEAESSDDSSDSGSDSDSDGEYVKLTKKERRRLRRERKMRKLGLLDD